MSAKPFSATASTSCWSRYVSELSATSRTPRRGGSAAKSEWQSLGRTLQTHTTAPEPFVVSSDSPQQVPVTLSVDARPAVLCGPSSSTQSVGSR